MSAKLRILKAMGESGMWKGIGRVHTWLYRATGGRVGHTAGHIKNLLLTTRGRRSGEHRTVALAYFVDGDHWILVASNGGADRHPAWWLNLRDDPDATIEVGRERIPVVGHAAHGEERARLWPLLTRYNPPYASYEKITARRIPVVVLARRKEAPRHAGA
jgi:deazaflavin-dependent oxidoreductase (nitroreductase family)